jgi:hypothetical protein
MSRIIAVAEKVFEMEAIGNTVCRSHERVLVIALAVVLWIAASPAQTPRAADPRFEALAKLADSK